METIAILNQKGGTGKTTTAHALGAGLARRGYRVLFVDLDAQGNLSYSIGAAGASPTIADLLQQAIDHPEALDTRSAIKHTPQGDIITSSPNIAGADTVLADTLGREYKLKEILEPIKAEYDYIVIDTPPTLGTLTINALTAADKAIAPAQADIYSMTALAQLQTTVETVKRYTNSSLSLQGILLTRYNARAVITREVAERLEQAAKEYGTKLYRARIRECTALKEAAITQTDIFSYAPRSNAAKDYADFIEEFLER